MKILLLTIVICYYMDASTQSVENNYDYLKKYSYPIYLNTQQPPSKKVG